MIVFFHACYIVTRYILSQISKSIFGTDENCKEQDHQDELKFYINDSTVSEAEFEAGVGIRFFPPVYVQRYSAVKDTLKDERWKGRIRKVVDFGCAEFGLFPYMKHLPGVQEVLTVDIDRDILEQYCCRSAPLNADYLSTRQEPLTVNVMVGSIADRDPRLLGTDAVICIELIEHLYPDTLEAVPYTVFGFIQPLIAIFTTPNSDFNVLFPDFTGFRHDDHKFEWTRDQFQEWAVNITVRYPDYNVKICGIGPGPPGTEMHGCCSQMAVFTKVKNDKPAPFPQERSCCEEEVQEEIYEVIREYTYPFRVDNRTDEEKILHQAEYYIRLLSSNEKYSNDVTIQIPVQDLLPFVETWCNSESVLRNILEEAGWDVERNAEGNVAVVYPYYGEQESSLEDEDYFTREEDNGMSEVRFTCETDEDWDAPQSDSHKECPTSDSPFLHSAYNKQSNWDDVGETNCELQENINCNPQNCVSGLESSEFSKSVSTHKSNDVIECNKDFHSSMGTAINSAHQPPCESNINLDVRRALEIQSCLKINSLEHNDIQHKLMSEVSRCSEIDDSTQISVLKDSNKEASLKDHKLGTESGDEKLLSLNSYLEHVFKKPDDDSVLDHNSGTLEQKSSIHCVPKQQSVNLNCSDIITRNSNLCNNAIPNVKKNDNCGSLESLYLNFTQEVTESSVLQPSLNQPFNFGSASSSAQDSLQDRSLVESCSFDEQNDKAVDSGYPNSASVQDMDMDLTPEQVDEISSESDEILTENSNLNSEDSECDSESSVENDHVDNDGLLVHFRQEALYDPVALVVENGDVANNNRDGEGNNAVAIVHPPQVDEIFEPVDHDLIPLLAAAEDFDNDNDVILPDDVQPFPHWLLQLLNLANHGGGDNNMIPHAGDGAFLLNDDGIGDDDDDEDDDDDPAVFDILEDNEEDDSGAPTPSSTSSEMGGSYPGSEGEFEFGDGEIFDEEVVVPGDIGGGGEPDFFHNEI